MRTRKLLPVVGLFPFVVGCLDHNFTPFDFGQTCNTNKDGGGPPDSAQPTTTCAAAQGIAGKPLVCVDFKTGMVLESDPKLQNWTFSCDSGGTRKWQVTNNALNASPFGAAAENCRITTESIDLNAQANSGYTRVTLALLQRVALDEQRHRGYVFFDGDFPVNQVHVVTGAQTQKSTVNTLITIKKEDILPALMNKFKFTLKASSSAPGSSQDGWQFESIAIIAN
ncbi:MAG: hypothetical protein U1A78_31035 [Polyangia bacterium]